MASTLGYASSVWFEPRSTLSAPSMVQLTELLRPPLTEKLTVAVVPEGSDPPM
jgi:hypothetical protein